ncbi:MAG: glycosyltransferase family 4 protein [Planctomycetota bacterium]
MSAPRESALTIAHVDAEPGFSGGEVQVFLLLEGLRRRGHRAVLLCPPGSGSEERGRAEGFDVRTVPMRGDLDLVAVQRLAVELGQTRPDLVHLHTGRATWLGGLAARWRGLPAITTRRQDKRVRRGWKSRLVYADLVRRAVAISPAVGRRLEEAGVAPERVRLIPSSVDPEALRPVRARAEVRAELGLGAGEPAVLVLAALVRRKGIDVLLEALAAQREEPALLVAGDGPEREALRARAERLGLRRVRFLGHRSDKAELLAACDVFALPSRLEGLGVAALEAMAAGRPVLATRVGGLAEAVADGETGLLVPADDSAALAAALGRLLADGPLRERLGRAGPARGRAGVSADGMVDAYEALYREVLGGR